MRHDPVDRKLGRDSAQGEAVFDAPIEELELSVQSYNSLKRVGIETIGDLVTKTESEVASILNSGEKSADEVRETLQAHGLTLRDA